MARSARRGITCAVGAEVCDQTGAELSATPVVERLVAAAAPAGWWLASCRLQAITKRADKLVAVCRVVLRADRPGDMRAYSVVANLYGPRRGERAHVVVHELVDGPTLLDHLVGGEERGARAAGEVGRWLARLHALDAEGPDVHRAPARLRARPPAPLRAAARRPARLESRVCTTRSSSERVTTAWSPPPTSPVPGSTCSCSSDARSSAARA